MELVETVSAHQERAVLRAGDVYIKVEVDVQRARRERVAIAAAPVPTPEAR